MTIIVEHAEKNGLTLCVKDVKDTLTKGIGKPLPKNFGVRCDKCIDEAPRKDYLRMHQCICKHDCFFFFFETLCKHDC